MALSPQWLDELRARVTLSSVVQRTTKLQRAGNEWKACCPFHNEKTPSFTVSDAKGFYHCFGCGAHGDVIRWMTDQRGLAFMDAVKELAAEAGMEVPAPDPRTAQRAEQQAGLHEVMQAAQEWFRASLDTQAGAKAREYLKSRGFDAHALERFGFGYAPNARNAVAKALDKFERSMLVEAGLLIAVDDKEPYDRFRDRLTIPIHDPRGRVIGFAARILDADKKDAPKYLNSPDTPLFDKGRTLFNLHRASSASRRSGRIVVVEGQMDAIAVAATGLEEVVAPMGTALTEHQIELLWRFAEKPILCFDGDAAGQRAALRAAKRGLPLLRPSHSLAVAQLPAGMDPDDIIRNLGVEAFNSLIAAPKSLLDFLWTFELGQTDLKSPEAKAGLKARLIEHTETILDPDIRRLYRSELLNRFFELTSFAATKFQKKKSEASSFTETLRFWMQNFDARLAYLHRRLGAAITAGVILWPDKMLKHAEAFDDVDPRKLDRRLHILIEFFGDGNLASRVDVLSFLETHDIDIPKPAEWDYLAFPFTRPQPANVDQARLALDMAVELYCRFPLIEPQIQRATALFSENPEGAIAEQQRLRKMKVGFSDKLSELLASARPVHEHEDHELMLVHA